jgi:very-short-patch-repair endonuclease
MLYNNYSDIDKKKILEKLYIEKNMSFQDIAIELNTYANKIRRDAIKFNINPRNKSDAQKNALKSGKHKHPTKGTIRSDETKNQIGTSVMKAWESTPEKEKQHRKKLAKKAWEALSEDEKQERLESAHQAVRQSSKVGSKLEKFLLQKLIEDSYKVEFHKEHILANTKLQIDLFLPTINIAIEVDGPSHFLPVWGDDTLNKNIKYDRKKSGLIIGKGLYLIRIKQIHDFSKARANRVYEKIKALLDTSSQSFQQSRIIEIED